MSDEKPTVVYTDSHAHLDFRQFEADREDVIRRARAAGVTTIINAGTDLRSSAAGIELAERYEGIFASAGFHPHDAKNLTDAAVANLERLARSPKVVAIGEIGLDYYRNLSPKPAQRAAFKAQLEVAARLGKPVIIHDRDAHEEILAILEEWAPTFPRAAKGVLHCFSGNLEMAMKAVEMGFYVSIAGPITYRNARKLPEIAKSLPLDRILIETDCPYLTPQTHRSKRNEPAYVTLVAEAIARCRDISESQVARATTENTQTLFGLKDNCEDVR